MKILFSCSSEIWYFNVDLMVWYLTSTDVTHVHCVLMCMYVFPNKNGIMLYKLFCNLLFYHFITYYKHLFKAVNVPLQYHC